MEVLYKGTVEERVHLIFALYDVTGKGRITKVEMKMASYITPIRLTPCQQRAAWAIR